ncbi:MAG: response regulator [Nitrososphaeria archaeon]|nr:response regulator [Nitrososphaeria archaeon]NDB52040.1 response regulator [Nitrosopumilaceae archaeon]NDB89101.1 response regulator [Nitrososphaerota archaeon]NDB47337.1 response regulator [Nitrososphaeria archaeon]NDB90246.1 response regulator [Nitrososphaerota archaeon]
MLDAIIVDDYDDHAELLEFHLKILGVKVVAKGRNGMEAFLLYKNHNPVFVFLDVNMPVYDGLFALDKIRKIDPSVRIIMITGDTSELTKRNLTFLGATEILYKPVDPIRLRDIVEREMRDMYRMNSIMNMSNLS